MDSLPFEITVNTIEPRKTKLMLKCTGLLREIPGKRRVYQGQLDGQNVIAKFFAGKFRASFQARKDWDGFKNLISRKLNSPELCYYGYTEDGCRCVITKQILNCQTALELYQKDSNHQNRLNIIAMIAKELAKLNNAGVFQKDTHLGNFLIRNEDVFALDVGQMTFSSKALSRNISLKQLAALSAFFAPDGEDLLRLCREYAEIRNWDLNKTDLHAVKKCIAARRKKEIARGLKKAVRTSKRYVKISEKGYKGVFDRKFYESIEPLSFIRQIDKLMSNGKILKDGNTCYVSQIRFSGIELVIKRYNHKGFFHAIRNSIKGSRASKCWLNGHLLAMLNIPTPKPLAFFEQHEGLVIRQSYIITEYIDCPKLSEILRQPDTDTEKKQRLKKLAAVTVDKMHRNKITHGDLKHSNILIRENTAIVTDLDGMTVHCLKALFERKRKKDSASLKSIC
ncbi:MAG: lipopolysaccharide kinase InaA family protein [Phycisphaerae bacterium]